MRSLLRYLILPSEITDFERAYLARVNRIAIVFLWLHLPPIVGVAALAGTSLALAAVLTTVVLIGPTVAYFTLAHPRAMALVTAVTAMIMGGVLVYVGQGPMQIEMHFYFFVLLALLAVFANPTAVVAAAVTVAAHHLVLWIVFVRGVFNYDASVWTVAVHAAFVVLETVAACFVARSFFDNVIGLEKIVAARTGEVDARNRDLRLVLDSVGQGFLTVARDGAISGTPSRVVSDWFGAIAVGDRIWDVIGRDQPKVAGWMQLGWETLADGCLPVELAIDQLPRTLARGERHYRIEYRPVGTDDPPAQLVVIVSDATDEVARERAEQAQRELLVAIDRSGRDRRGFVEFVAEADRLMAAVAPEQSLPELQRNIHTIKGNTALFGVTSVSAQCHAIETRIAEDQQPPSPAERDALHDLWHRYRKQVAALIGDRADRVVEIDRAEFDAVLAQASGDPRLTARLRAWRDEPVAQRLTRLGEQAQALASRLGKAGLEVTIEHDDLALEPERWAPLWSALVHAVRNAVDHGIEPPALREAAGKPAVGRLTLRCERKDDRVVIEIADDGRGVDWDAISARATEAGLQVRDRSELHAAMFADGVSTRREATEISGRGVGMGALRAVVQAMGGVLAVDSQAGAGTQLRFTIPAAVGAAPARARRLSVGA